MLNSSKSGLVCSSSYDFINSVYLSLDRVVALAFKNLRKQQKNTGFIIEDRRNA